MAAIADARAYGGLAIAPAGTTGSASWTFTAPTAGSYVVWCRVYAPDGAHDSFFVAMDGGAEDVYDEAEGIWSPQYQWTRVNGRNGTPNPLALNPRTFALAAGTHTLKFRAREAGATVDRLIVTSDTTFVPTEGNTQSFLDVGPSSTFYPFVETVARRQVASGCGSGDYCPQSPVTRAQMAVLLLRGEHGGAYAPPTATGTLFSDVPATGFAAAWIERLVAEGVTAGCGGSRFCPADAVTRAQMAVFLLRALRGPGFIPPAATGMFTDVAVSSAYAPWIEQIARDGVTGGCGAGRYCPANAVNRGQMAVFLVKAFQLV
jgi:hypothetical protein